MFSEPLFVSLCIQEGNIVLVHVGGMGQGTGRGSRKMDEPAVDCRVLGKKTQKTPALCQGRVELIVRKG